MEATQLRWAAWERWAPNNAATFSLTGSASPFSVPSQHLHLFGFDTLIIGGSFLPSLTHHVPVSVIQVQTRSSHSALGRQAFQ